MFLVSVFISLLRQLLAHIHTLTVPQNCYSGVTSYYSSTVISVICLIFIPQDGAAVCLQSKTHFDCIRIYTSSRDMGQTVHNYKRVVKGLWCMTIKVKGKGLGEALGLGVRLRYSVRV